MHRRHISTLVAGITIVVLCGSAIWLAGQSPQPADEFEKILRNPLEPRDHSQRVDRLALTETFDAFQAGSARGVVVADRERPHILLAQTDQVSFPRRGTWTGPETAADFRFTELVASWNAITPRDTGAFFQIRTRDAKSRKWSPWLFVGRWGRTVNARFDERLPNDRFTRFTYGAVENHMPLVLLSQPADAYQVRATLQSFDLDPAINPGVRRVAVAYSGVIPDPVERARLLGPVTAVDGWVRDLPVPHVSQREAPPALRESVCMPSCVTMVLAYWKVDRPSVENALAIYDPDSGMFGNGSRAAARAGELGLDAWMQRVRDWEQVKAIIGRGEPVIAAVHREAAAHLIVIRGFSKDGDVLVNDPLDRGKGGTIRMADELGRAWFGCGGFACVIRRSAAE
jgi:hypothetical protein